MSRPPKCPKCLKRMRWAVLEGRWKMENITLDDDQVFGCVEHGLYRATWQDEYGFRTAEGIDLVRRKGV